MDEQNKNPKYPYIMWYDKPAESDFYKGLPIGNGRMGGMIYGNPNLDILHINECTVWTGSPYTNNLAVTKERLDVLSKRQFGENPNQDEAWEKDFFYGMRDGNKHHGQTFQYAGKVLLSFPNHENFESYKRELDLNHAIASCSYTVQGTRYTKEYFANHPSNVIASRITSSDKPLDFEITFSSDMKGEFFIKENILIFDGITDTRKEIEGKLKFIVAVMVLPRGGRIKENGTFLKVLGAKSCDILITVATNFKDYKTLGADYKNKAFATLVLAQKKGYDKLRKEHINDYTEIFDKVSINLGKGNDTIPVDERIEKFKENEDASLLSLFFQYNRYLMISSSRDGGQPANLQGIWNNLKFPPWDSKYTTNINLQMNYFPVYTANLHECANVFVDKIIKLTEQGRITAKKLYSIKTGWVLHHNTDLWNITGPVDGPWGLTPTCGAWLANQLFDHYLYTMDRKYLKKIYKTLKGAAEFMLFFLTEYKDEEGNTYLVTCPSTSPELVQRGPETKYISFASAFDNQIVHQLFSNMIQAAKVLRKDSRLIKEIEKAKEKLPPCVRIGRWGQVQEFLFHDYDDPNDAHRHISNLIGVYPLSCVDIGDMEIRKAVETTLTARSKPGDWTLWGIAWRIAQYARLCDADKAYRMLKIAFDPNNRLVYPNLFGAHPIGETDKVFQIDGNFGTLAGMCEMFVCSAYNYIHLLPALPDKWKEGCVYGLCARGGFILKELVWSVNKLVRATIYSTVGGVLTLRYKDKIISVNTNERATYVFTYNEAGEELRCLKV